MASSPNFDSLSVRLSRMIDDPVAAAATNGDIITSAKRTEFLNNAIKVWMMRQAASANWMALRGYMTEDSKALVGGVLTLGTTSGWDGGVFHILSAVNTTPTPDVIVKKIPEEMVAGATLGLNKYGFASSTQQFYAEDTGRFGLLGGGATDTIKLRYVRQHRTLSAGDATGDTLVEPQYFDEVLQIAYGLYCLEYPTDKNVARLQALASIK